MDVTNLTGNQLCVLAYASLLQAVFYKGKDGNLIPILASVWFDCASLKLADERGGLVYPSARVQ